MKGIYSKFRLPRQEAASSRSRFVLRQSYVSRYSLPALCREEVRKGGKAPRQGGVGRAVVSSPRGRSVGGPYNGPTCIKRQPQASSAHFDVTTDRFLLLAWRCRTCTARRYPTFSIWAVKWKEETADRMPRGRSVELVLFVAVIEL